MADKKISEFGTFPGKQDEETYYVIASGDSSSAAATNYKVPFTDLALSITGDLNLGGGSIGSTDPANNTSAVNFNQGENVRMYIDESGGINVSEKLIVADGKETILGGNTTVKETLTVANGKQTTLGGPLTVKGSTTHEGGLFTTSDTTTTLFKGPNTFGDSVSDITNFVGTTNITGPLSLKDPAFSDLTTDPNPSIGKLYRKGDDLYFNGKKLLTDGAGGGAGKWSDGTTAGQIYYSGGNVGIGTVNPIGPLHVISPSASANTINMTRERDVIGIANGASSKIQGGALAGVSPLMGAALGFALVDTDGTAALGNTHGYLYIETKDSGGSLTEKMRITSDGNVGIGTTSPSRTLTVAGLFQMEKTQADGGHVSLLFNSGGGADHPELNIYDKDGNAGAFILKDGNVGIGTGSPTARLDIWAPNASNAISVYNEVDNDRKMCVHHYDNGGVISLYNDGVAMISIDGRLGTPNNTYFNAGNVGIGTTNPSHPLTVLSPTTPGSTFRCLRMYRGADDTGQFLDMGYNGITVNRHNLLTDPQSTFSIFQKGSDDERNVFHIGEDGNVGIGTATPNANLHIFGPGEQQLFVGSSDAGGSCLILDGGADGDGIGSDYAYLKHQTDGKLQIRNTAGDTYFTNDAGNVGFGTDDPKANLHLLSAGAGTASGDLRLETADHNGNAGICFMTADQHRFSLTTLGTNGGTLRVCDSSLNDLFLISYSGAVTIPGLSPGGSVQANTNGTLSASSDKRLKNDLGDSTYGLNEILQIVPKKFTWKDDESETPNIGFFAQDIVEVIPEAAPSKTITNEDGEEDTQWGFSDRPIIAALVNSIKELKAENDSLRSRIEVLES